MTFLMLFAGLLVLMSIAGVFGVIIRGVRTGRIVKRDVGVLVASVFAFIVALGMMPV